MTLNDTPFDLNDSLKVYSATGSDSQQSQSLGKVSSEAKLNYVNERKTIELENARKASVERKKKILKGENSDSILGMILIWFNFNLMLFYIFFN